MTGKVLVIFDLDQTLTVKDTYLPYLITVLKHRPGRLLRCMMLPFHIAAHLLGLKDNTWLKVRFLDAILKELSLEELKPINADFVQGLISSGLNEKMMEVLGKHIEAGDRLILLSASLDCYVTDIGRSLGFSEILATQTRIADNRIAGGLAGPNLKGVEKVRAIETHLKEDQANYKITAYADDASDRFILAWADNGYWIRFSPGLNKLTEGKIKFLR